MIAGLCRALADRRPCRLIRGPEGEPYLERYFLCRLPGGGAAYLHRFVASDPDRGLHDHPWRWAASLVLAGGYFEKRCANLWTGDHVTRRLRPGRLNLIRGHTFHQVLLPRGWTAWSLFVHGGYVKGWGFLRRVPAAVGAAGERVALRVYQAEATASHPDWWRRAPRGRDVAGRAA